MHRIVHDHGYVRRGFDAVCDLLVADATSLLRVATREASEFADDIAEGLEGFSEFFDVDEGVEVETSVLRRHRDTASLCITWEADPDKRLLPSVSGVLELSPIVPAGPGSVTEIELRGEYDPPHVRHRGATEFFLERRVVNAALHMFLDGLARALEERIPSPVS